MIILSLIVIFIYYFLFYVAFMETPINDAIRFYKQQSDYKNIVVCCGDSITHGHIGYDWLNR